MRLVYPAVTFTGGASGDLSGSISSDPIKLDNVKSVAIQAVLTGTTPAGTLKVQASCDVGEAGATGPASTMGVTTWSDVANATKTFSDVGDALFTINDASYPWVRLVWTRTSGTGAITAKATARSER